MKRFRIWSAVLVLLLGIFASTVSAQIYINSIPDDIMVTEDDLIDPQRFAWRKGDPMWHMVAANTWEH